MATQERIEYFDPQTLENCPGGVYRRTWTLEYGVPLETLRYVLDQTFPEDWVSSIGNEFAGFVKAMDRVEELARTAATAFAIRRPMQPGSSDYEYAVFRANFPKGRK